MAIPRKIRRTPDEEFAQLQIYEQAYLGYEDERTTPKSSPHHPERVLSKAEINDPAWKRLWKPRNFLAKVVEEPLGYLGMIRPRINGSRIGEDGRREELDPDDEGDAEIQSQLYALYERIVRPRQADLVLWQGLYGRSFAKVTYDPGTWTYKDADGELIEYEGEAGLHVVPYPRFEAGIERAQAWHDSEDPDRVTSAVVYWFERDVNRWDEPVEIKHAQLLYPDRVEWLVHSGETWVLDESRGDGGIEYHPWGLVPVAVCWNNAKPDVHDGLAAQEILNKDLYDQNAAAQNVAFPQRYRIGLIPTGGWARNPLTGRSEAVEPLRAGPHIVWDVPEGGSVGQLQADSGEYLREKYRSDIEDLATLCRSVNVAKMKIGLETSGESKSMDTIQILKPRLQAKAEGLAACIRDIMTIILAMARTDSEIARLAQVELGEEIDVDVSIELDLDRDEQLEAQMDLQDRANGNLSLYSYLIRRGMSESEAKKEAERLKAEREEMMAEQQEQDPYGLGGAAGGIEPGGNGEREEDEEEPAPANG